MTRQTFRKPAFASVVSADLMWATAVVADRKNNGDYIKTVVLSDDGSYVVKLSNRDIIKQVIKSGGTEITAQDIELGKQIRSWHQKNLLIKILKAPLSDFDEAVNRMCGIEEFSNFDHVYEIAILASQIKAYRAGVKLEEAMGTIKQEPIADIGTKINTKIRVIKHIYSRNYGVYFITGVSDTDHMVMFSYRDKLALDADYYIRGNVKRFMGDVTQLNRVKVV